MNLCVPQTFGPLRSRAWHAALALLALLGPSGCGREFFREWANQDVSEAVFEKSRDPRFRLDAFSVDPPALSRFADPYDPDVPPAPPDDRATEALSPVPQWPDNRLLVPTEGTGYLDLLDAWWRAAPSAPTAKGAGAPAALPPVPPPTTGSPYEARPRSDIPLPRTNGNSGTNSEETSPIPLPSPPPRPGTNAPQTLRPKRDLGARLAAYQRTGIPEPLPPPAPGPRPPARDLPTPPIGMDPENINSDLAKPANPRPDLSPEQYSATEAMGAEMSGLLIRGGLEFDEAEAAGLVKGSQPYRITMSQAFQLALINSRPYQFQLEQLYLASLAVTLQRFTFQPQFYAGLSPLTSPLFPTVTGAPGLGFAGGLNPINQFFYATRETGTPASTLSLGTVAGVGKAFDTGARLVAGFANQIVFNFFGKNSAQPTVRSFLPLSLVVPFLRGGGRAVTLELLTQAERNLVYQVRTFAQFRQQFIVANLVGGSFISFGTSAVSTGFSTGVGNTNEPVIGFVNVLEDLQIVENNKRNIAAYEQLYKVFNELKEGEPSGLTQLQVDQVEQSLNQARLALVASRWLYRNDLDNFKIQIGLPPDTPLMLDRTLTMPFKRVFDGVEEWAANPRRRLEDLPSYADKLPKLQDVVIDGRSVLGIYPERGKKTDEDKLEELLLAAERTALEHRLDLMNARAQLYDNWRQIRVTANALKGVLNVAITNQFNTPLGTNNPLAFLDQAKQFSLVLNAELPLIRLAERNNFRASLINYQRERRFLQNLEDTVKLQVRVDIRTMHQQYLNYEIARRNFVILIRLRDQAFEQIIAPPQGAAGAQGNPALVAAQTTNLVQFQSGLIAQENNMVTAWQLFQIARLQLYRDLGILPYDEWEALSELFPSEYNGTPGFADDGRGGPPGAATAEPAQAARGGR